MKWLGCLPLCLLVAFGGERLPVFLADNHAESFGWVSRTVDLDEEYVLVLTDAHSDASAAERSDEIREQLRRVVSIEAREGLVEAWRVSGRVQAFNWIEPLMPRPFGLVVWVAPGGSSEAEWLKAGRQCDGRLEVEPRSVGSMAERWSMEGMDGLEAWTPGSRRVIWSLDLDYFAGMEEAEAARQFERMWIAAMDWPGLAGVCVAVSRPWLASDEEADRLVTMVLSAVDRTRSALLEIDASVDDRPDDSLKSREGRPVRWDLAASPVALARVAVLGDRCRISDRKRSHDFPAAAVRIEIDLAEVDLDRVWRLPASGEAPILRLHGVEGSGRVRWWKLEPARKAYDLLPETGLGKGFSEKPGRWVFERRTLLATTEDFALLWKPWWAITLRTRVEAEYEKDGLWFPAGVIEMRFGQGSGVARELIECMGMPYVFGIAGVEEDGLSGVETGWGGDCSNLLIHAWRRCGEPLEWGDPGRLRAQLVEKHGELTRGESERGVLVDFGKHVAMLIEDREPRGRIGPEDRVFHHLGGFPEFSTVAELQKGRPRLRVWTLPERETVKVRVAGDVTPVGDFAVVDGFEKMEAGLFLANLEGVPTSLPVAGRPAYDFRFSPDQLGWLRGRGIDAVSLANNHAGDAGPHGLVDALGHLERAGIGVFGAGRDAEAACRPWVSKGVACFGVSIVGGLAASVGPGIACLPDHAKLLEKEMLSARARGESLVVLVHGGDEFRSKVNDGQRRWARWLVSRGARLVAGSGPHILQREERHGVAVVAHSLGNAVFPVELKGEGAVRQWPVVVDGGR